MDWITEARLAAQAKAPAREETPKARRRQQLGLPDREAIALPAADGKRVLVTQPWHGSKHKRQPCITYTVDDPTPRLFTPGRAGSSRKAAAPTQATQPDLVRYRDIIGTHDLTGD